MLVHVGVGWNEVYLRKDGLIYKAYRGDQTADFIKKLREQTEKLAIVLRQKNQQVLILVDLSKLGKTNLSARNEELEFIKNLDFDKAAVFGENFITGKVAKIIVNLSGMGFKINFSKTREEAINWLKL